MKREFEAAYALSLPPEEAENPKEYCYWTGWERHNWPVNVIKPGMRFYAFDKKSRHFRFLLEVTKCGVFTYQSRAEFNRQVLKITRMPAKYAPHFSKIPSGKRGEPCIGIALRWKIINPAVNIRWHKRFFPQLGWARLDGEDSVWKELCDFEIANKHLKRTTRERLIDSRLGQGEFRRRVLSYWQGGCAVTGCSDANVLRASHIKPWAESDNREKLDPFNGLALIPNLDAAFDQGLISFQDDGRILISPDMDHKTRTILGISSKMRIKRLEARHFPYLKYHRRKWGHEEGGS
jgi:hypothetical protein